ncbi:MAG TPA: DUF1343 domain-containing protein [Pyrinomonadaceae bacterium]|jgi:uncharacterized protein YbbC (DUF1343 family)
MKSGKKIQLGIERLLGDELPLLKNARVGLLCNQASVNRSFHHAADLLYQKAEINLTALFGPQHGIRGDVQDNMIETGHSMDSATDLPVYSLYSETREPTDEMLENIDILVCDLQDVGCRIYTFVYTMANCMKVAGRLGKKVIVCDRPNPINGISIEGNVLDPNWASFVGMYPIPVRHGLTIGELALFFKEYFNIECELEIVPMRGWERQLWLDETDAPWVLPSPNMPTVDTAAVFPATVFFEGTQVSEGRGTTRPFEFVGAPYINSQQFAAKLNSLKLPGVYFRAAEFQPTFQKHAGKTCGGVQLHVLDRETFQPVRSGLEMVKAIVELYGEEFKWKNPPYEYVYDKNPFDVISGTDEIRRAIENKTSIERLTASWQNDIQAFVDRREPILLY